MARPLDGQRRVPPGAGEELGEGSPDDTCLAGLLTGPPAALDPAHHVGVEAEAGVDGEVPVAGQPEPDPAGAAGAQRFEDGAGRVERVRRQPDCSDEDVGGPAGDDGQGRHVRPRAVGQQAVDDLVDGAVAAEGDDHVDAVPGGAHGERGGVATVAGLLHLDLQLAAQRALEHLPAARRRGGGLGVDDQERAHTPHPMRSV